MPLNRRYILSLIAVSLVLASAGREARSQAAVRVRHLPEVEARFQEGVAAYASENYDLALKKFRALVNLPVTHQMMTASLLMTGKTLYKLGAYNDALAYFHKLINVFPASDYVDDARHATAAAYYRMNRYPEAVRILFRMLDRTDDQNLVKKSARLANYLLSAHLTAADLRKLSGETKGPHSAALLATHRARKELLVGSRDQAVEILNDYKRAYDDSPFLDQIDQLLDDIQQFKAQPVRVGVVLPLTGYYRQEGLGILRGMKFAQSQQDNDSAVPIQLVVRDSRSDIIQAINEARRLISRHHVRVLVGELESTLTAGVGVLSSHHDVPLLAPAATAPGLTTVGHLVFQLNSDLERKGEALAEYAIQELGMKTFATLAPADDYGQQMVASFTDKVDELGGRIVAQAWYYGDPEDLSRQFEIIREAAFHYDSTDVEKMLEEARQDDEDFERRDIPVLSIDGMFMPVYTEDLQYVAPQFALYNIRAQVLGGEYWDDLEVLQTPQVQRYINGAIFVSDYFPDEQSSAFRDFRVDFRLKMGTTPERWAVFGYDALRVVRAVLGSGAATGRQIVDGISGLDNFEGIKGKISFKGGRVNREVNFLQFIGDRIIKLK